MTDFENYDKKIETLTAKVDDLTNSSKKSFLPNIIPDFIKKINIQYIIVFVIIVIFLIFFLIYKPSFICDLNEKEEKVINFTKLILWLVGILVISIGGILFYNYKMSNSNKLLTVI